MQASAFTYPATIAAIDIGGTKIAGATVTFDGSDTAPVVDNYVTVPTLPMRGGDAVLSSVVEVARTLVETNPDCVGVGVDAAGIVNPKDGSITYGNGLMPGWTGQPLRQRLKDELGLPAAAMGDVQAHALGEMRWGVVGKERQSCLLIAVGTGLGGAFIVDGHVVRGRHGAAGHFGHSLHAAAAGIKCQCGSEGHAECVTSGTAISAIYQGLNVTDRLDPALMGDTVSARAAKGEQHAIDVLRFCGRALGEAIGSWCNIIDPECVVLSGTVTKAGPIWRDAIDEGFATQILQPLADIPILQGALGGDAPLIGAAENLRDVMQTWALDY